MTNIIGFPGQASAMPTSPSFLHGWPFLAVIESEEECALPIRGRAHDDGPTIEINALYVTRADLEDRSKVALWLCPTLLHVCGTVLAEGLEATDGVGRFTSQRWRAFRSEVSRQTTMGWPQIVAAARREGVDYMADHLTASLFMENGLDDRLGDRHA
ncbi:hypothetical protein [Mesorhizobium sp.]|uniref:hypothetical protein n=1 Tax=Mesorhizobium sp. TaxID=1871066 RepID=UPI000FE63E22|nr:hypothetical protein [Mesorhizobium sp.]RWQ14809.1 MAG: hypothetical protein EOR93_27895 [Mesorhizobium sp.]